MTTVNRTSDPEIGRITEVRLEGLTLRVVDVRRSIEFTATSSALQLRSTKISTVRNDPCWRAYRAVRLAC